MVIYGGRALLCAPENVNIQDVWPIFRQISPSSVVFSMTAPLLIPKCKSFALLNNSSKQQWLMIKLALQPRSNLLWYGNPCSCCPCPARNRRRRCLFRENRLLPFLTMRSYCDKGKFVIPVAASRRELFPFLFGEKFPFSLPVSARYLNLFSHDSPLYIPKFQPLSLMLCILLFRWRLIMRAIGRAKVEFLIRFNFFATPTDGSHSRSRGKNRVFPDTTFQDVRVLFLVPAFKEWNI